MVFGRGSLLKYLLIVVKSLIWTEKPPAQFGSLNTAMRRLNPQLRSIQVTCAISLFDE